MAWLSRHLSTAASRSSQIRLGLSGAMDFTRFRVRESPFRNFNSRFNLAGKLIDALRSNNHWRAASGGSRRAAPELNLDLRYADGRRKCTWPRVKSSATDSKAFSTSTPIRIAGRSVSPQYSKV
jgi:hypothetical protein